MEFVGDKIRAIRVYWDQATVLKQLEIVGSRGRGWPITDGPKQINLINQSGNPTLIQQGVSLTPNSLFHHREIPTQISTTSATRF